MLVTPNQTTAKIKNPTYPTSPLFLSKILNLTVILASQNQRLCIASICTSYYVRDQRPPQPSGSAAIVNCYCTTVTNTVSKSKHSCVFGIQKNNSALIMVKWRNSFFHLLTGKWEFPYLFMTNKIILVKTWRKGCWLPQKKNNRRYKFFERTSGKKSTWAESLLLVKTCC